MKEMRKKIPGVWIILVILTVHAIYWCIAKEGYYIDELWSYGLSNGYYTPFLHQKGDYMNNWHQSEFYGDYLAVRPVEVFSYGSVYDNQVKDVHPPLYYMILHTVCSWFPGRFSKWFGLPVNLLFYCGSILLLYKISGQILGKKNHVRLIPPFFYGLSMGAVATLIYIRMYMLLTFWALLFVFLAFYLMKEEVNNKRILILSAIGATVTAGFLTQYYFAVFVFFFSAAYMIRYIMFHKWRRAVEYAFVVCAGVAGGILIFPASLRHIFLGQQGRRAFANASNDIPLFLKRWGEYRDTVMSEFLGDSRIIQIVFVAAVFSLLIAAFCPSKRKNNKVNIGHADAKAECIMLFVTVLGYFSVIVQISPEVADRYQFIIYPFCVLVTVAVIVSLLRKLGKGRSIWIAAGICLVLMMRVYAIKPVPYVYEGYKEVLAKLGTEYKSVPGIYVTAGDHLVINNCLFLAQQEMTYPLTLEQINELPKICEGSNAKQLILYVDIYYNELQTAGQAAELLGYRSYVLLYDNTFTQVFLLTR